MKALLLFLLLAGPAAVPSLRPQATDVTEVGYVLSMPNPASHLFEVSITVQLSGQAPESIELQMPRWQPGRYSVGNFASNVQEFSVRAGSRLLQFEKPDDHTWRVQTAGNRSIEANYRVFGNDLSGTFAQLDATHGNYNGGEIFMYVAGHKQAPVELQIRPPAGWRIVNAYSDTANQSSWRFPNYETLIDTPTEIGPDWTLDEFSSGGKSYRVVVHSRDREDGLRPNLFRELQKIVEVHTAMWGPPEFDRYTFLYHFAGDNRSYDGMEHLNSTQIIQGGALADPGALASAIETASHEFFHVWNVKRLRPAAFGPWDWTRPANTPSLWFAEGITEYYGKLMLARAGLWTEGRLLQELAGSISDIENSSGGKLMSAVDSSLSAPFIDAAVYRQRTNLANTSISYYTKGELIGLVLDLTVRSRTGGRRSLDDVLKQMYDEFYVRAPNASYYLKGRGFTEQDFVRVLSEVAGTDMQDFYNRHIKGTETLPYDEAFKAAGLKLVVSPAETFSSGIFLESGTQSAVIGALRTESAATRAGLQQGDVLLSIDGAAVNRQNWRSVLDRHEPGDKLRMRVQRFNRVVEVEVELAPPMRFSYRIEEVADAPAEAQRLRGAWLGK